MFYFTLLSPHNNHYVVFTISFDKRKSLSMEETTISQNDTCVCCGAPVPEGRMVCKNCEANPLQIKAQVPNLKENISKKKEDQT